MFVPHQSHVIRITAPRDRRRQGQCSLRYLQSHSPETFIPRALHAHPDHDEPSTVDISGAFFTAVSTTIEALRKGPVPYITAVVIDVSSSLVAVRHGDEDLSHMGVSSPGIDGTNDVGDHNDHV